MPVDVQRLRALPLFSSLADDELEQLSHWVEHRQVGPGTRLTLEGAAGYSFFVIEDGQVTVERGGELLETLAAGDFFGEMAIIGAGRRNATATAASQVDMLVLFGTEFRSLEQEFPAAAEVIRQKMAERAERSSLPRH